MAATKREKTIIPGVTVRTGKNGLQTVRFACMINRTRFTRTVDLPVDILVDPRTGRPTGDLRVEYNMWVEECGRKAGRVSPLSNMKIPTIEELIQVYEKIATDRMRNPNFGKPSERAIYTACTYYRYCVEESGLSWSAPASRLLAEENVRRIFNSFATRMKGTSAWTYVVALASVTARWALPKYRELGLVVEPPTMPDVGNIKKPPEYKMLTPEQKSRIEEWYTKLAATEEREMFMAASIVAQLAVRPGDVGRLDARNFVRYPNDDYVHLAYTPHKTMESSNRRVDWPIRPALWELICSVGGQRLREGRTLMDKPAWIFRKLNASMREACGMEEWNKAVYELRKLCIDTVRREQGVDAAVAISGDRRETIDKYYSDPYRIVGITPLEIMPMGNERTA